MGVNLPIEVNEIDFREKAVSEKVLFSGKQGDLVKIRPCGEEYGGKTYLGFLLGEISIEGIAEYYPDTKTLKLRHYRNPAIFVPELGKIIYGIESWWGIIQSESELSEITNDDISKVWYVKMWKAMQQEQEQDHGT